ncbi:MAG: hypothetical protein ACOCPS_05825 [Desulfonatronovibrio sp.]
MIRKQMFLIVLSLLCMGMSGTGALDTDYSDSERFFRATIVDESDNSYQVRSLSVEGSAYLPARTGAAEASIDFGKIERVRFHVQDKEVKARVVLNNGEEMDFSVQPDTEFLGKTDWGRISFQAISIKEISFR